MDIRKVAAKAKVSTATVSRTINSSDAVAPAPAAKVWAAIRDLNYHPTTHARSLSSSKSHFLSAGNIHFDRTFGGGSLRS